MSAAKDCLERLKRHFPEYDKSVPKGMVALDDAKAAVRRAKDKDQPQCKDWPRKPGKTTVYRLVENILAASDDM